MCCSPAPSALFSFSISFYWFLTLLVFTCSHHTKGFLYSHWLFIKKKYVSLALRIDFSGVNSLKTDLNCLCSIFHFQPLEFWFTGLRESFLGRCGGDVFSPKMCLCLFQLLNNSGLFDLHWLMLAQCGALLQSRHESLKLPWRTHDWMYSCISIN